MELQPIIFSLGPILLIVGSIVFLSYRWKRNVMRELREHQPAE